MWNARAARADRYRGRVPRGASTGRGERAATRLQRSDVVRACRQADDHPRLAPFPARAESEYDTFGVGHSSTSISAALGMAVAAELQGRPQGGRDHRRRRHDRGHGLGGAVQRRRAARPTCWSCSTTTTCRSPKTSARCPTTSPRCCRGACIPRCVRAARRSSSRCPRCGSWRAVPKK